MALRLRRGLGRTPADDAACDKAFAGGFFWPTCWTALTPSTVAPPQAPPLDKWVTPPASGDDAQQTVDDLLNQQLRDQQTLNGQGVKSSWWDSVAGGSASAAGSLVPAITGGVPWGWLAIAGVAVFGMVALSGGSPRRYGR
jgi:hypothetical protein